MRWLWALLLLVVVASILLISPSIQRAQSLPPDFVTGADHNKYIRLDVSLGSASPGQLVHVRFNPSVWSLCNYLDCRDLVVVDSSGTVVPFTVGYVREVTIHNPNDEDLNDFQVKVVVDTATPISEGKMRPDCGDIRFYDSQGNKLPYWIESGCGTSETVIWVRVPHLPAGGSSVIYMYYGNAGAISESNAQAVFLAVIDGLRAAWPMDECSGDQLLDHADGYHASIPSSVSWESGKYGCALGFAGSSYVNMSSYESELLAPPVTIAFWMNVHTCDRDILGSEYSLRGLGIFTSSSCELYLASSCGGYNVKKWGTGVYVPENDWEHVVMVYTIDGQQLYLNGQLVHTNSYAYCTGSYRFALGRASWGAFYQAPFKGVLDEVYIFGRALSPDEVNVIYYGKVYPYGELALVRKYVDQEPVVTLADEQPASLYFDPGYDGSWSSRSFYVLLGSDSNYASLRSELDVANVGDFDVLINAPADVTLYSGSASVSVSPDTDEPGEKTVTIHVFSEAPTGVRRTYCHVTVHDPLQLPVSYDLDENSDTVSFTYTFNSEGVYLIDYNCYVFFTSPISGSATRTVYIPDPSVPSLSLSVSGIPSVLTEPSESVVLVSVTSGGSPVSGATCYFDYEGNTLISDTNSDGLVSFTVTFYPDTDGTITCYKSGYHPATYNFQISSQQPPGGGGGGAGGGGAGGAPSAGAPGAAPPEEGAQVSGQPEVSVQQAAPVSAPPSGAIALAVLVGLLVIAFLVLRGRRS